MQDRIQISAPSSPQIQKPRSMNLQDAFLNQVRRERQRVTLFLVNGVKMSGVVRGFDSFVVIVEDRGLQQVIYKHAISTMIPSTPVVLLGDAED